MTLYLFDMDGTLIRGFLDEPRIDYDIVEALPRRREKLADLLAEGHRIAIITNQRGVAFGYQTEDQAHRKIGRVLDDLGLSEGVQVYVCYHDTRATDPAYADPELAACGKPSPTLLIEAMRDAGAAPDDTVMIGDRPEDEQAAANAGVRFIHADDFFAEPLEYQPGDRLWARVQTGRYKEQVLATVTEGHARRDLVNYRIEYYDGDSTWITPSQIVRRAEPHEQPPPALDDVLDQLAVRNAVLQLIAAMQPDEQYDPADDPRLSEALGKLGKLIGQPVAKGVHEALAIAQGQIDPPDDPGAPTVLSA
jgi:D-glycero-D-manno-heptose 1,7-bisphosphate phosphatase